MISKRYIKFIDDEYRCLYFIISWIAASLAKAKVVFELKKGQNGQNGRDAFDEMAIIVTYPNRLSIISGDNKIMIEAYETACQNEDTIDEVDVLHEWN